MLDSGLEILRFSGGRWIRDPVLSKTLCKKPLIIEFLFPSTASPVYLSAEVLVVEGYNDNISLEPWC